MTKIELLRYHRIAIREQGQPIELHDPGNRARLIACRNIFRGSTTRILLIAMQPVILNLTTLDPKLDKNTKDNEH